MIRMFSMMSGFRIRLDVESGGRKRPGDVFPHGMIEQDIPAADDRYALPTATGCVVIHHADVAGIRQSPAELFAI